MNTAAFVERVVLASAFLGGSLFIGSTWALAVGPCEFLTGIGAYGRQDSLQWRLQQCQRDEENRRSLEKAKHRIEQHRQRQEATAARRQQAADEVAAKRAADEAAMPEWQQHQAVAVRR